MLEALKRRLRRKTPRRKASAGAPDVSTCADDFAETTMTYFKPDSEERIIREKTVLKLVYVLSSIGTDGKTISLPSVEDVDQCVRTSIDDIGMLKGGLNEILRSTSVPIDIRNYLAPLYAQFAADRFSHFDAQHFSDLSRKTDLMDALQAVDARINADRKKQAYSRKEKQKKMHELVPISEGGIA